MEKVEREPLIKRGFLGIPAEDKEIERGYFMHLCDLAGLNGWDNNQTLDFEKTAHMCYFLLAVHLHTIEFMPIFPNDENRAIEGMNLRSNWALYSSAFSDYSCLDKRGCSFLEMLVALSISIDQELMCSPYDDLDRSQDWFWVIMNNLGFDSFNDACWDAKCLEHVTKTLYNINHRTFDSDGKGGLFPLKNPQTDQRTTEIWYQANAFVIENYDELDLIGRKFGKPSENS